MEEALSYGIAPTWWNDRGLVNIPKAHCSEGPLIRRSIIPKVHWSEGALVRRCIGLKVHYSEN